MVASSLATLALSIILGYGSFILWAREPLYSSISLLSSLILLLLAIGVLRGNFYAMNVLSVFYMILAVIGIMISPQLPSEGILTFVFSFTLGFYIWKYRHKPYKEKAGGTLEDLGDRSESALPKDDSLEP